MWQELLVALSLVLIIEGILPFLYPNRWKELAAMAAAVDDKTMRIIGFSSMALGLLILQLARA
jgi:uncharacterized protein YjeT (DUF2065 family)